MFQMLANAGAEAIPSAGQIITTLVVGMGTGIGAVWTWFRAELTDCKNDRKTLFADIKQLNKQVAELSERVGHVERDK